MPAAPRRAALTESAGAPTPASAYVLERKLLRAYDQLYRVTLAPVEAHPAARRARCVALLGGNLAETQQRGAEKRLREVMPELIQKLTPEQQPQVAALLLHQPEPCLLAVVAELVRLERNINYRDDDPRLKLNDDARLKAAGMGRLSKAVYGNAPKLGPPLVLTPWVPPVPRRAVGAMRASHRPIISPRQLVLFVY